VKKRKQAKCAVCKKMRASWFRISRDGKQLGPVVDVCKRCGSPAIGKPDLIWVKIGQAALCHVCSQKIEEEDRSGSYHTACYVEYRIKKEK
jgi:hypothetical protein